MPMVLKCTLKAVIGYHAQENPLYLAKQEKERIARGEVVKDAKGAKKKK